MKRFALIIATIFLVFNGFAQKQPKFTEEDAKQFYQTVQGDYIVQVNDSTTVMVHFTPIWENVGRYQWLYVEAIKDKNVVFQKVLKLSPKSEKIFNVYVYSLKNPQQFAGKWGNPNYFDGFNTSIVKGGSKVQFMKTSDYSYQTTRGPMRIGAIDCFPQGDLLHIKFVQEDERFYIKRVPKGTNRILGYQGLKELTD